MTRKRVQRPFIVEIKGRSRSHPLSLTLSPEPAKPSAPPPSVLWAGTDLGRELARTSEVSGQEADPQVAPQKVAKVETRRILPSLLVAEPIKVEPDPEPTREPKLPHVRRATGSKKPVRVAKADRTPTMLTKVQAAIPAPVIMSQAVTISATVSSAPLITKRVARAGRLRTRSEPLLKPGQRWMRRLPRVCR